MSHITAQHHPLPQRITTKAEAVAAVETLFPKWDEAGRIVTERHHEMDRRYGWHGKYEVHVHYGIDQLLQASIETFMWWALDKNTRLYKKARPYFTSMLVPRFIELTKSNAAAVEAHYENLHQIKQRQKRELAQYVFDGEGI